MSVTMRHIPCIHVSEIFASEIKQVDRIISSHHPHTSIAPTKLVCELIRQHKCSETLVMLLEIGSLPHVAPEKRGPAELVDLRFVEVMET